MLGNLAAWVHGSTIVYPNQLFDPPSIVDAVVQERCTALHGVPTHFLGVLAEVDRRREEGETLDLSQLRFVTRAKSFICLCSDISMYLGLGLLPGHRYPSN